MTTRNARLAARFQTAKEAQKKLTEAFKLVRREGLIARQSYLCCRGCAGAELANEVEATLDAGKEGPKGYVFYTKQQGFVENFKVQSIFLAYGAVHSEKYGDVGLPTVEVGRLVCDALTKTGLTFKWNGSPDKCIEVNPV